MITVQRYGNRIIVRNPVNGQDNTMLNVVFVEEGRGGADAGMTESANHLSRITGETVGLSQLRVHTQPILESKIHLFEIGKQFPGYINRGLYSTAQLKRQTDPDVEFRMLDGRPTYFKTWISDTPRPDADFRVSNEVLMTADPAKFMRARVRTAQVATIEYAALPPGAQPLPGAEAVQGVVPGQTGAGPAPAAPATTEGQLDQNLPQ